jgi:hypothetical protein
LLFYPSSTQRLHKHKVNFLTYAEYGKVRDIFTVTFALSQSKETWLSDKTSELREKVRNPQRIPFQGLFEMRTKEIPEFASLFKENGAAISKIRLIIVQSGIWFSIKYDLRSNIVGLGFWSHEEDNLYYCFSNGSGTVVKSLLAALFWDAHSQRDKMFSIGKTVSSTYHDHVRSATTRRVYLPTYSNVCYSPKDFESWKSWKEKTRRAFYGREGHYRWIGTEAPPEATERAISYGFEPPPYGYTFVQPSYDGLPPRIRQLVCEGYRIIRSGLSDWKTFRRD